MNRKFTFKDFQRILYKKFISLYLENNTLFVTIVHFHGIFLLPPASTMGEVRILVRGNIFWCQPCGGSGEGAPRTRENFGKISKNFLRKLRKKHYFSRFLRKFIKPCVNFSRVWKKNTNYWDFCENFLKFMIKIQ